MGSPKIFNFWGEEKWRQAKLAREFLLASPFRRGTVATMTTMACQVSMRMMIMISNASNQHAVSSLFSFLGFLPNFKGYNLGCRRARKGFATVNRTNLRSQNATLSIEVSLKSQIVTSSHGDVAIFLMPLRKTELLCHSLPSSTLTRCYF